jgi:hypothetical protein
MRKVTINNKPAIEYHGVYFFYPENCTHYQISHKDQANRIDALINGDNVTFWVTEVFSNRPELSEKEYQARWGTYNEELGVFIGEGLKCQTE